MDRVVCYLDKLILWGRYLSGYSTMLCYKRCCAVMNSSLLSKYLSFQLRINKSALDKNSNKTYMRIERSGSNYDRMIRLFLLRSQ